jgi:hypothetical protein
MPVKDFDAILNAPGVDLTGTNPANLVDKEDQLLNPPRYLDRHFIAPAEGPFFENDVRVWRVSTDPNGGTILTELQKGVDWYLTHKYMEASYYLGDASPPRQLYASISFYNLDLVGRIKVTYQKLGGPFSIRADQLLALLGSYLYNPRMCSYEQIAGAYVRFPPTDHPTDANTIEWGTTEISSRLADIEQAILNRIGPPVYTVDQVNGLLDQINDRINQLYAKHQTDKSDLTTALTQLRDDITDDLNSVKTTVNVDAYVSSGE